MSMVRRVRVVVLFASLLLGLVAVAAGPVAADSSYTCPDNSCAFSVPDYYSVVSNDATSVIFKDANSGGTFTAGLVPDFPATATLDDAGAALQTQFATADGYQADPRGVQDATIAGNPARSFYFMQNNSSGTQVEVLAYFSVYQGKLYLLSFATTPDQEDAFVAGAQPVFDSWQFTQP
jgi:hypothetical protein